MQRLLDYGEKMQCVAGSTPFGATQTVTLIITTGQMHFPLCIRVDSKVLNLKEKILRTTHIAINEQLLSFGGKVLEEQKSILQYCIHDFSFI